MEYNDPEVGGTFEKTKPTESHQIRMLQVYLRVQ